MNEPINTNGGYVPTRLYVFVNADFDLAMRIIQLKNGIGGIWRLS